MCACGRERLHVLVSVWVSVWALAEGRVSSNLGQTRDGKVNAAVKLKDRDAHAQMRKRDKDVEKHAYGQTERRAHKRRYLWETRLMWKGQNSHGIHRCTPPTCAAFISVCASACVWRRVRVCVLAEAIVSLCFLGAVWYSSWEGKRQCSREAKSEKEGGEQSKWMRKRAGRIECEFP